MDLKKNDRSEVYNIFLSCLNNGLHVLNNINEPTLRLLLYYKFLLFPTKLGVKTSNVTKLCDCEYISRSTCLKSLVSYTVWKV